MVPMTMAKKQFKYCDYFTTQPSIGEFGQQGINFTFLTESTLLIMSEAEAGNSNAPLVFNDDYNLFNKEDPMDFGICNESMVEMDEYNSCLKVGTFNVHHRTNPAMFKATVINTVGQTNDTFFYPVEKSGKYCFYGYHSSEEPGIQYKFIKPYGSLNPIDDGKYKVLTLLIIPLEIAAAVFMVINCILISKKAKKLGISTEKLKTVINPKGGIIFLCFVTLMYHYQIYNQLNFLKTAGYDDDFDDGVDKIGHYVYIFLNVLVVFCYQQVLYVLFIFSHGCFAILRDEIKPSDNKKFKIISYTILMAKFVQLLELKFPNFGFNFSNIINALIGFIIPIFGDLLMYIMIWKSSRKTALEITNLATKRKFKKSAKLVLLIPISLQILSIFLGIAFMSKISLNDNLNFQNYSTTSPNLDESARSIIVETEMEKFYTTSLIMPIFGNLIEFSLPLIIIGLGLIWRQDDSIMEKLANDDRSTRDNDLESASVEKASIEMNEKK